MPDFAEQLVMSDAAEPVDAGQAAQPAPAADPAQSDRPRNADGTFAPKAKDEGIDQGVKQEAASPQPAAQPQPEPPSGDEGKRVPLEALTALKQKLAEREAELAKYQQQPPAQPQQPSPQPPSNPSQSQTPKLPDFSFDPSIYQGNPEGLFEARLHKNKMDMSTVVAVQQYGADTLAQAWAAFDQAATTDPTVSALSMSLLDNPHPMGEIIKWYQRQKEVTQLTEAGGLDKLREQIRAQLLAEMQGANPAGMAQPAVQVASAVPMPQAATAAVPPSLAKGGSGHGAAPERPSDNDVFENIFDKSKRLSRKSR